MNLIYSDGNFKATKFSESQFYGLDEITFFIEKKYVKLKFYLIVKDSKKHFDVVALKQINSTNPNYYNFECDMSYPVKICDGNCAISVMGIDQDDFSIRLSTPAFSLQLKNELYNFKTQIALLEQFNKIGADIYNKTFSLYQGVAQMSNINVQMLKDKEEINI